MVLTLELTHILLKELNFYIRVSWYNLAEHMFQIEIFAKSEDGGAYSVGPCITKRGIQLEQCW